MTEQNDPNSGEQIEAGGAPVEATPDADGGDKSETLLSDPGEDKPVAAPADWPEDWRAKVAGEDEKLLKRLDRFKSPGDIVKSWRALEQKVSSGEVVAKLPKDASEEQVAEYRKANGIPEKSEGYLDALSSGVVIGEDDKALVGSFLESAHAQNASPEVVSAAIDWYYGLQEEQAATMAQADRERKQAAEDELRAEWGGEYRANINSVTSFLDAAPEGLKKQLLGARLADGSPLGDNPDALRWLVSLANEANPAGFIAPSDGASQIESVETEIKEIEKTMREDRKSYDRDEAMQKRYLTLIGAREKLKARA